MAGQSGCHPHARRLTSQGRRSQDGIDPPSIALHAQRVIASVPGESRTCSAHRLGSAGHAGQLPDRGKPQAAVASPDRKQREAVFFLKLAAGGGTALGGSRWPCRGRTGPPCLGAAGSYRRGNNRQAISPTPPGRGSSHAALQKLSCGRRPAVPPKIQSWRALAGRDRYRDGGCLAKCLTAIILQLDEAPSRRSVLPFIKQDISRAELR